MAQHFGVNLRANDADLYLNKNNYLTVSKKTSFDIRIHIPNMYKDDLSNEYSDEWCEQHKTNCFINYDLNMKYFESLDHSDFDKKVAKFVKAQYFEQCLDLNRVSDVEGIYMMVLDRYTQAYIGTSENIKRRIMRHWANKVSFDRLLFPIQGITTSKLSIDSFRALDTTRIFVCPCHLASQEEYSMVNKIPDKYLCNRISGGTLPEIIMNEVIINPRSRDM